MGKYEEIAFDKELYLFEIDNVLIAKRDYFVQVFYLFGSFIEFNEATVNANEIATFMAKIYDLHGEEHVLLSTKVMFNLDDRYDDNYYRLVANAQLPLKLTIFPEIELNLQKLKELGKEIAILTKGNPVEQLNKLRFIEWGGLGSLKNSLKVFFADELAFRSLNSLDYIASEYNLKNDKIIYLT